MANEHVTFTVEGISDEIGATVLHDTLICLNGVENVIVDVAMKRVAVEYDAERMHRDTLRGTIEDEGYKVR
jgi:hypothetical protein